MEELIPWLYLKGISTGDFTDALSALVGKEAPGLSAPTISRLKGIGEKELDQRQGRDLSQKQYMGTSKNSVFLQDQVHLGDGEMKNTTLWGIMNIFMYFIHDYGISYYLA